MCFYDIIVDQNIFNREVGIWGICMVRCNVYGDILLTI